jgi:hypothetical protein
MAKLLLSLIKMDIEFFLLLFRICQMEVRVYLNNPLHSAHCSSCSEILTAYQALPQLSMNPENTIFDSKRFIGRRLVDCYNHTLFMDNVYGGTRLAL